MTTRNSDSFLPESKRLKSALMTVWIKYHTEGAARKCKVECESSLETNFPDVDIFLYEGNMLDEASLAPTTTTEKEPLLLLNKMAFEVVFDGKYMRGLSDNPREPLYLFIGRILNEDIRLSSVAFKHNGAYKLNVNGHDCLYKFATTAAVDTFEILTKIDVNVVVHYTYHEKEHVLNVNANLSIKELITEMCKSLSEGNLCGNDFEVTHNNRSISDKVLPVLYFSLDIPFHFKCRALSDDEKVIIAANCTHPPSQFCKYKGKKSTLIAEKLDLFGIPMCNKRGSAPAGNDISIYYPGFHDFVELCETTAINIDDSKFTNDLCLKMADVYEEESLRVKVFIDVIELYLNYPVKPFKFSSHAKCEIAIGPYLEIIGEVKNEGGLSGGDSYMQVNAFYQQSLRDFGSLYRKCSAPRLLVELVGPSLIISGAVYGEHFYFDRLAHLWLVQTPHNSNAMCKIAKTFKALQVSLSRLTEYYQEVVMDRIKISQPRYPCFQSFDNNIVKYVDTIKNHVFRASLTNAEGTVNVNVIVKFTENYCVDAHKLLFECGHAPKIHHRQKIGRFFCIVMDEIEGTPIDMYLEKEELPNASKDKLFNQCQIVLDSLSNQSYCHGDLRPCNILVTEEEDNMIKVLDFDWAGKCGRATYPFFLNHEEIQWPSGAQDGEVITKDHDKYWIDSIFSSYITYK